MLSPDLASLWLLAAGEREFTRCTPCKEPEPATIYQQITDFMTCVKKAWREARSSIFIAVVQP